MKKFLTLFAATLVAASLYAAHEFPEVSVSEVKKLSESKTAVIIDVNGTDSFNKGHVPGALNYDAVSAKLSQVLPKDKKTVIVAYCGGPKCQAYKAAATAAAKLGYKNVKHMTAGISGWKEAGEKMEKGS